MKKLFTFSFILFSLFAKADYWTQKATFPGSNRDGCFSFSIGTKGYIGCGYDTNWTCTQTFWEYNLATNSWTQKADFAGPARIYATGFSISNMGYAGTGVSPATGWMQDFWKYDPATNTWSPIADFGGGQRSEACCFIINNKAYMGTGTGTVAPYIFDDLWEYNPLTNIWTGKAHLPGPARVKAMGYAAGNYGYIATGYTGTAYFLDLWQYDPVNDSWLQKLNFPADPKGAAAGFTLYNQVYLGTGINLPLTGPAYASKDWWVYTPSINSWLQKNSFAGAARYESVSFTMNNRGYLGLGINSNVMFKDLWEYIPDIPSGIDESTAYNLQFTISPNPARELLVIRYSLSREENLKITIRDVLSKIVYSQQPETGNRKPETKINVSSFPQGLYFVELTNPDKIGTGGKEKLVLKFIKE